jgi:cation diffusion facilitator CzcD-associated flavoprotein CzcO
MAPTAAVIGPEVHRPWWRTGAPDGDRLSGLADALAAGARPPRIAILGAGAGGLCAAIRLRAAGIDSFTVYEKSDGVGGTWRDNSYPGAGCDVPSHLYSFSFAPKLDWSRKFAGQPEILGYFEALVDRFDLRPHLRFGVEVTAASWDDEAALWRLTTAAGEPIEAEVVISALGQLNRPYVPDLPGLDGFAGTTFHSARWNHDHDLAGERVAVVGIGASAIQFVPRIAEQAGEVVLFQRSANYVAPKPDREFRPWERWLFTHVPALQRAYRESIYWRLEGRFALMRRDSRLGRLAERRFRDQIRPLVSDRLSEAALIPDYPPGCRRILIADDWYPTLLRPNVRVVTEPVTAVAEHAVVTADGEEHPVDAIVFGTGFRTTEFLSPLRIRGRDGADLDEAWAGGARAYLGLAVPRFPNLFLLYGPNTNLGHNSILFMIEQQVAYALELVADLVRRDLAAVEVTAAAAAADDEEVQAAAARTVWAEGCHSWYKNAEGRITNNWVGHTTEYRRRLARVDRSHWDLRPARTG